MQKKRDLSPYERTQLQKYNIPEEKLLQTEAPVEYLTHHVEFCELDFFVDNTVLIPRVETETLVDLSVIEAKKIYAQKKSKLLLADIGTGSGAIAVSVTKKLEAEKIPYTLYATDVSTEALHIAEKNAKNLAKQSQIQFLTSNLLEAFLVNHEYQVTFDLIVSNLPYIPSARIPQLDASVVNYEPKLALDGGESGLELIHQLIKQARLVSTTHTQILLEVDYTHTYNDFVQHKKDWEISLNTATSGVTFVTLSRKEEK